MTDAFDLGNDDDLLAVVGESIRHDRHERSMMMAFEMRDLDAVVATLIEDTSDQPLSASVRGAETDRALTFRHDDLTIEIVFEVVGGRILGQLLPPQSAVAEVETESSREDVPVDELGRFVVQTIATRLRLRVVLQGRCVVTPWIFR
jgi:hypothetical protein